MTSGAAVPDDVSTAIAMLSVADDLLVATDFDGTIAPIVPNPADARPLPESIAALRELATLPDTRVAVISGRSLQTLRSLTGIADGIRLIGSHGAEFDDEVTAGLTGVDRLRLAEINRRAARLARRYDGVEIEAKPASTAIHYRHVSPAQRTDARRSIESEAAAVTGARVIAGKMVVEIAAFRTSKGVALDRLRAAHPGQSTVYLGDDVTDEDAFARLTSGDLGIKVGAGSTRAGVRVDDPHAAARVLALLAEARRRTR